MKRRLARLTVGLVLAAGCRHAVPRPALPADWTALVLPPTPYRALYRLSCCGRRGLLAALRGSDSLLHVSVAAPPAGSLMEVWIDGRAGSVLDAERRCLVTLPAGELPLTPEVTLPLAPAVLAVLASGRIPAGAVPMPDRPGWVAATVEGAWLRVRATGSPARSSSLEVGRPGESGVLLRATMSAHRGLVPGVLDIEVGGQTLRLELQVWEQGTAPVAPAWLGSGACGGEG
ncbi:MAG: hypothetical protein MUF10_08300 [Thermoanaerobaculaceae bacterium]|nr:hypothetical protein [Thermoanaerobaculaceae bacterium]